MPPEPLAHQKSNGGHGNSSARRILLRKTVQALSLIGFVILFVASQRGGWDPALVNLPMRLDPLVILAQTISSRIFLISSTVALITIVFTIVFGRAWCGWLCPFGTLLDIFSFNSTRKRRTPVPEVLRAVKYSLLLLILAMAVLGSTALLFFDPLTILFRTLSTSIWPALDRVITAVESGLYSIPFLRIPISTFDQWIRPLIFPAHPVYYKGALLLITIFSAILCLNLLAERFWCRYICPLGGLLGLISKFALFRRRTDAECTGCALCAQACPTGTIDPKNNFSSDPSECTLCLECLPACPRSVIHFRPQLKIAPWQPYDPTRRQVIKAIGVGVLAVAVFRSEWRIWSRFQHLIRPPGSTETGLLAKCIRCGECTRACPTSALQPVIQQSGSEGVMTPYLIPRLGYCDYSCNACGLVCPVQAIPPLTLAEKRQMVIGHAYIDEDRCIAWADHQDCIVCEEMCPVPDKAIQLEPAVYTREGGSQAQIKVPRVSRDRCIGCGICEYKCPVNGEAAIRVFLPNQNGNIYKGAET